MELVLKLEPNTPIRGMKDATKLFEEAYINLIITFCKGDKVKAAKLLDIHLASLYRKTKEEEEQIQVSA